MSRMTEAMTSQVSNVHPCEVVHEGRFSYVSAPYCEQQLHLEAPRILKHDAMLCSLFVRYCLSRSISGLSIEIALAWRSPRFGSFEAVSRFHGARRDFSILVNNCRRARVAAQDVAPRILQGYKRTVTQHLGAVSYHLPTDVAPHIDFVWARGRFSSGQMLAVAAAPLSKVRPRIHLAFRKMYKTFLPRPFVRDRSIPGYFQKEQARKLV